MSDTKFYDQARIAFQKLSPKAGDTLTMSFPKDMPVEQIHTVVTYVAQLSEEFGCNVMMLGQGVEVNLVSEEEMAEMGWVRTEPTRTLQ